MSLTVLERNAFHLIQIFTSVKTMCENKVFKSLLDLHWWHTSKNAYIWSRSKRSINFDLVLSFLCIKIVVIKIPHKEVINDIESEMFILLICHAFIPERLRSISAVIVYLIIFSNNVLEWFELLPIKTFFFMLVLWH